MKKFPSILLICISLLFILSGCRMSKYSKGGDLDMSDAEYEELMPFSPDFEKALYKADLSVNGREFAGLMMIKAFEDDSYKLAFFSELGLSFFDFELRSMGEKNQMNLYVRNIYSPLDKNFLLNKFEKYFSMLLGPGPAGTVQKTFLVNDDVGVMIMMKSYKGKDGYISTNLIEPYKKLVNKGGLWNKEKISIAISKNSKSTSPESIIIEQPGFRLKFKLSLIE